MSFIVHGTELCVDFPRTGDVFSNLSFTVNSREKIGLTGRNGSGKSTLCRLISGELDPQFGVVRRSGRVIHVAQCETSSRRKLSHGQARLQRLREAFAEATEADLLILDEPSNHLDQDARHWLSDQIERAPCALLLVSHDREILRLVDKIWHLEKGLRVYGGAYDFFVESRLAEAEAFERQYLAGQTALKKARKDKRAAKERQAKRQARGKASREAAGLPKILLNKRAENAEVTAARLNGRHDKQVANAIARVEDARARLATEFELRFDPAFLDSNTHRIIVKADELELGYEAPLWSQGLTFELRAGERIRLAGKNGAGKSTLIENLLGTGKARRLAGTITLAARSLFYLRQDAVIPGDADMNLVDAAMNLTGNYEHALVRTILARAGFPQEAMLKPIGALSGGERVRLWLATWFIGKPPELLILDEPENNLDLETITLLEEVLREAPVAIIVVTHDNDFAERIGVTRKIYLTVGPRRDIGPVPSEEHNDPK